MIESFHAIVRYSAKGGTGKETVLAHGVYGGTALVPAAAAVPFMTLIPAAKPIHIVAIEDVVETVAWALRPDAPGRVTLDLVHPEPKTLAVIITGYRDWLGLRPHPVVTVPGLVTSVTARVADALSWLGWRSPIRTSAIRQLADGINGNPAGWIATTGITPKSLDDVLAISPATVQDRWFARLYLIKPLAIAVLAAFWIMTGLIALGPGWDGAKLILRIAGANAMTASIAVSIGAIIDIVLCGLRPPDTTDAQGLPVVRSGRSHPAKRILSSHSLPMRTFPGRCPPSKSVRGAKPVAIRAVGLWQG